MRSLIKLSEYDALNILIQGLRIRGMIHIIPVLLKTGLEAPAFLVAKLQVFL
jgi:hypothetical protein